MAEPDPIVIVVDDDQAFLRSTKRLIGSMGYKVQTFAAAGEFLRKLRPEAPAWVLLDVRLPGLSGLDLQRKLVKAGFQIPKETACLILDVRMPGMDGLELQRFLGSNNYRIPIIFVTAQASDNEQRLATQAGAVAFLRKPVSEQAFISADPGGIA